MKLRRSSNTDSPSFMSGSILMGPTWRQAMLASLVSSASPSSPLMPPVTARLMWDAPPLTLGLIEAVDAAPLVGADPAEIGAHLAGGATTRPQPQPQGKNQHQDE